MKKIDLTMLIIGLVSLVLAVITSVILVCVFMSTVKKEVESGRIQESLESYGEYLSEKLDGVIAVDGSTIDLSEGVHVDDGNGTIVDIGTEGIHVEVEDGDVVDIDANGVNVSESGN